MTMQTRLTPIANVTPTLVRVPEREKSGVEWVQRFPGSNLTGDLEPMFRTAVNDFISAIQMAGGIVKIAATYRPPERAYLMHWSFLIAHGMASPSKVPPMDGVNIEWDHGNDTESINAATAMVNAYGMSNLHVAPALSSRHTQRKAIDMSISWSSKDLKIKYASGKFINIDTIPKTGMNAKLCEVGASYGVIKFKGGARDKPHWSTDGR